MDSAPRRFRPPGSIVAAAVLAFVIAGYDVIATAIAMQRGTSGAVLGTLFRDALFVLGGVMLFRRARWAVWLVVALGAFALVRALAADDAATFLVNLFGVPIAILLLVIPASRAWVARSEAEATSP